MEQFNPYDLTSVAEAPAETRADFIRKTYAHVAGALAAFALLEAMMLKAGLGAVALRFIGAVPYAWLMVLGGFMIVGWLASRLATSQASPAMQYLGLALYTLAEAVIFLPMLALAIAYTGNALIIGQAAVLTGALVLGITTVAFTTRKDFSFLGGILKIGGFIAIGLIVASFFLPISLGLWFSVAMVLFAGGAVLYDTSNIIHRYQPGDHVAASLSLFASIALLLWYVLRILMAFTGRD
jgi:FtsH-binding integral membrane protein